MRRSFVLPSLTPDNADKLEHAVGELPGVCKYAVDADKQRVVILYDASKTDYETVSGALVSSGFVPQDNWWSRLKGGWFQFTDTNARDNAKAPPPACCNKSPK